MSAWLAEAMFLFNYSIFISTCMSCGKKEMKNIFPNYFDNSFCCRPKTLFFENRLEEQNNKYLVADGMRLEFCVPTIYINNKSIQCAKMVGSILCRKRQKVVLACPNKGVVASHAVALTAPACWAQGWQDEIESPWNTFSNFWERFWQIGSRLKLFQKACLQGGHWADSHLISSTTVYFSHLHLSIDLNICEQSKLTCYPQYEIDKIISKFLISLITKWWLAKKSLPNTWMSLVPRKIFGFLLKPRFFYASILCIWQSNLAPRFDNQNFCVENYHGIALTGVIHIYELWQNSTLEESPVPLSDICTLKLKNVSKAQKDKLCVGKRDNSQAGSRLVKNTRK